MLSNHLFVCMLYLSALWAAAQNSILNVWTDLLTAVSRGWLRTLWGPSTVYWFSQLWVRGVTHLRTDKDNHNQRACSSKVFRSCWIDQDFWSRWEAEVQLSRSVKISSDTSKASKLAGLIWKCKKFCYLPQARQDFERQYQWGSSCSSTNSWSSTPSAALRSTLITQNLSSL